VSGGATTAKDTGGEAGRGVRQRRSRDLSGRERRFTGGILAPLVNAPSFTGPLVTAKLSPAKPTVQGRALER